MTLPAIKDLQFSASELSNLKEAVGGIEARSCFYAHSSNSRGDVVSDTRDGSSSSVVGVGVSEG